jgi:hypothetical protein
MRRHAHYQIFLTSTVKCRQLQEQHRPLQCKDMSKCSTGLCIAALQKSPDKSRFQLRQGDTSRCCRGPCGVDTSRCCRGLCSVDICRCHSGPHGVETSMCSSGLCNVGTSRSCTCSFCPYKSRCCGLTKV